MSQNRIKLLKYVVIAALGIISVRLFFIQIIEHSEWLAKADEQHTILETIPAERGKIYMMDRDEPVAVVMNQTTYSIIIDPAVTDKSELQDALQTYAPDYISANLDEVYATEGLRYYVVAKGVPHSIATKIADKGLSSVWFQRGSGRVYLEGETASGLLGFVNADGLGQYGVEGSLNNLLSGKDGLLKSVSDVNNVALSIGDDNIKIPAENGQDVVLSVDRSLERGVEEITVDAVNSTVATNASVLIMNANTGEVLTMANVPNYNPADYGNVVDASAYTNYVTEVPYEPASICKNFAFSAAINEGVMTPDTTYFNQGYEIVDDWKINNATQTSNVYGTISMRTALYWSLNTGSIYALKLLGGSTTDITQQGREKLYDYYYNKFRLGQPTGIELIEAIGYIEDPNEGWGRDSTYANMTFGQNLQITMLQTATAFSAVVNGGYWRTPSIVKGTMSADGTINPLENTEKVEDQILTSDTSAMMREMLIHNRDYKVKDGTDKPGYDVGGKSGTAQVVVNGAYDDTYAQLIGSYIGFVAPSGEMPQYIIMTKMWGEGQSIDSGIAMDLFNSLSNYVIDYLKIKPNI
ncbi:penicillin-binding protein 2 [Candidatus Saccharibacteria bacterium]|nr:penicillin-binding protein 2 [Candidatus Saccharibacteria bacterium]